MFSGSRRRDTVTLPRGRLRAALANASLRTRVMAAAAILVAVTSLATGLLGTTLLRGYLLQRADAQLVRFAHVASGVLSRSHPPAPPGGGQPGLPTEFLVEIVSPDGHIHVAGNSVSHGFALTLSPAELGAGPAPFTVVAGSPAHSWRVVVQPLSGEQHAVIALSLTDLYSTVQRLEVADALAGIVAVALLALIGMPLVRTSLGPLRRIEATAAAIAAGDLSQRIDHPSSRTEAGRLASALNSMLSRIEAAYQAREAGEVRALASEERMRQFVADASHELRTPLTSLRGLAEYALQQGGDASPAELLRLMALVQREATRMGLLVEDLLMLAQFDLDRPLRQRPVDLASIAAEAVRAGRLVQADRPITLSAPEPVVAWADDGRVRQVLDNLIGNALQHTPRGSPITVTVTGAAGSGHITVADRGPGLTAEQASRVFERFYRTDQARTRARGGTGLGLSIAAAIVASHGGDITVDTAPGRGAAFHVTVPLAAPAEGSPAAIPEPTATRSQAAPT
jgi:two-component system OmpR family sensor kinase